MLADACSTCQERGEIMIYPSVLLIFLPSLAWSSCGCVPQVDQWQNHILDKFHDNEVVCHRELAIKNSLPHQPCHLERLAFPPGSPAAWTHLQETSSSQRLPRRTNSPAYQLTSANTLAQLFLWHPAQIQGTCIVCLLFLTVTAQANLLRQSLQSMIILQTSIWLWRHAWPAAQALPWLALTWRHLGLFHLVELVSNGASSRWTLRFSLPTMPFFPFSPVWVGLRKKPSWGIFSLPALTFQVTTSPSSLPRLLSNQWMSSLLPIIFSAQDRSNHIRPPHL